MTNTQKNFYADDLDDFISSIEEIGQIEKVKILHADFVKKRFSISIEGTEVGYPGLMDSINFCRLTKKMRLLFADFSTGEITVEWVGNPMMRILSLGITTEEIELLKKGKMILAIKSHRQRTNLGLAASKRAMDKAVIILREQDKTPLHGRRA